MPLTLSQKSSIRRHLGYPVAGLVKTSVAGNTLASGAIGYRFTQAYGFLEYKMNNLNPDEEARLTGSAVASIALVGPQPAAGAEISATITSTALQAPVTISYTLPQAYGNLDSRLIMLNGLAQAVALSTELQAIQMFALSPYGTGPYSQNALPFPEMMFVCPTPFTIALTNTGVAPQLTSNGVQLSPFAELAPNVVTYGYIPILDGLEAAFGGASQNLDTLKADVWQGRSNEIGQRMSLYRMWRAKMSDFLGTPINPQRFNRARRMGALNYM